MLLQFSQSKTSYLLTAFFCFFLAFSFSLSDAPAQKRYDELSFPALNEFKKPEVHTFTLDNGIKFFLVQDNELPLIKMNVRVRTGEILVGDGKLGLTDVLGKTMRSGGTENYPSDTLNQLLENNAASMETGMGFSSGSASMNVLKEDFDRLLPVFVELLNKPAFPQEKIDLAKKQLKSQISRRNDNQSQIANREFNQLIYGEHSAYGRIMQYATVNTITREDVISLHEESFTGENMMIGVVGDFDRSSMEEKLKKSFEDYPAGGEKQLQFPDVDYEFKHSVNFVNKPDVNQSMVVMGHIGGYRDNPDYASLQVMNKVLSGGFSGRLLQKIRTEMGLSYSPHGQFGMNTFYPGKFKISVRTKSSSTAEVIKAVKEVIHNLQQEKITVKELKDAKDQFLNSLVFRYDSHEEVLQRQIEQEYKGLPPNVFERFVDSLKNVTRKDVQRVAREYLKPDKMQILVVGNKEQLGDQLQQFGSVNTIDISIPTPGGEDTKEQKISGDLDKGAAWLQKMSGAILKTDKSLEKVTTKRTTTQYNSRLPDGKMTLKATSTVTFPDQVKTVMSTPQGKITIQLKNGKATRIVNGRKQSMPTRMSRQIRKELNRSYLNVALASDTLKARYQGEAQIDDKSYVKLQLPLEPKVTYYIDPGTRLPHMLEYNRFNASAGKKQQVRTKFTDWKHHDDVAIAHKQQSFRDEKKVSESEVSSVKITFK